MAGLVPAIHVLCFTKGKTWMPGTSPGMTACYLPIFFRHAAKSVSVFSSVAG